MERFSVSSVIAALLSRRLCPRAHLPNNISTSETSKGRPTAGPALIQGLPVAAMNPTGINASVNSAVSISNSRINSNNTGITGNTTTYGGNKFCANAGGNGTPPAAAGGSSTDYGLQ